MPKIRCQGCEAVLNVPDAARGKTVGCPKCGTKIKIPGDAAAPASKTATTSRAAAKKAPAKKPQDQELDFGSLDLNRLQGLSNDGAQVCPYCAAELNPEDPVCRACGMNVQTGQMDRREERRRSLKGPDPQLFFKNSSQEGWEFMKENVGMAMRSSSVWWFFMTMNAICSYMAFVYCQRAPTITFWTILTIISASGIPGWFLYVALQVITSTINREKFRSDRLHFDMFKAIAGGTRTVFWPLVVIGPLLPVCLLIFAYLKYSGHPMSENYMGLAIAFGALQILPILTLPIALVHMTTKHTYKAWILFELLKILSVNLGAVIYLIVISLFTFFPTILVAGGIFYLLGSPNPMTSPVLTGEPSGETWTPGLNGNIALWLINTMGLGGGQESVNYAIIKGILNMTATGLIMLPIAYLSGMPSMFLMRVIAAFGYYRNRVLDTVPRILPGTPATFWVRYLAHTVDLLFMPLAGFIVTSNAKAAIGWWVMAGAGALIYFSSPQLLPVWLIVFPLYTSWMYWSIQESSQLRSTMGKDVFGLMVTTDTDQALTTPQASFKWFLRFFWYFSFGIPFLMSAFREDKKTLHDLVTHSQVVFRGDR